jgi:BA14K-like protein
MPIGVTVSGDIVFPFQCKDFIERQKGTKTEPAAEDKRAPGEVKPAPADNSQAAVQERAPADDSTAAVDKSASAEEKSAVATDKPTEEKSTAVEDKPAAVMETVVAKQTEDVSKPAPDPVETVPLQRVPLPPRRAGFVPGVRHAGPPGCMHFRTYDPDSGTYRSYDGQRRTCR